MRLACIAALSFSAISLSGCMAVQRNASGSLEIVNAPSGRPDKRAVPVTQEQEPSAPEHPQRTAASPIGTTFQTGKYEVRITSVKPHEQMKDGKRPKPGNRLIYVNVKLRNIGSSTPLNVRPTQFALYDANGDKIKPFKTKFVHFNARQVRPVDVGLGAHTTFVYEIPKDGTGYVFAFRKTKDSLKTYRWAVW